MSKHTTWLREEHYKRFLLQLPNVGTNGPSFRSAIRLFQVILDFFEEKGRKEPNYYIKNSLSQNQYYWALSFPVWHKREKNEYNGKSFFPVHAVLKIQSHRQAGEAQAQGSGLFFYNANYTLQN